MVYKGQCDILKSKEDMLSGNDVYIVVYGEYQISSGVFVVYVTILIFM